METLKPLQTYFDLMVFNGSAFVFQTARAMGIFQALGATGGTPEEIAVRGHIQPEPCRLMLDCLKDMGLVDLLEGCYRPTPTLSLLAGPYSQLGKEYWNHLPKFMMTGQPLTRMDDPAESEKEYLRQVESLDWMMRPSAVVASKILAVNGSHKSMNILDLGAGSGVWSMQMLADDPAATATLVDWPSILNVAMSKAKTRGVESRVTLNAGNYHEIELGLAEYDRVIMGNVAHIETEAGLNKLIASASRALKPGGELVIFDVFPTQEQGKLSVSLYALGLSLRTETGRLYSYDALKAGCQANRFIDVKFAPLEIIPYTMGMVVARRLEN